MNWKDKKVFVTGGTGFIGTHLCNKLGELGVNLNILVHKTPPRFKAKTYTGDIINNLQPEFIFNFEPEIIFHLAAQPIVLNYNKSELKTLQTNIDGTYNLLHVCKNVKSLKSFVHISTDKVYGNTHFITEFSHPNAVHHPYNASKLAGDSLAQMYSNFFDVPTVIIRNANVYGAGDIHFDRIIPRTIQNAFKGEKPVIRGDGRNTRDYIHVDDVVEGYIRSAELPYGNKLTTLNLSGFNHSVIDVVDAVLLQMNRVDLSPVFEAQWKGEIPHQHIVNDVAKDLIDWSPKNGLADGLSKTIPWYTEYLNGGK